MAICQSSNAKPGKRTNFAGSSMNTNGNPGRNALFSPASGCVIFLAVFRGKGMDSRVSVRFYSVVPKEAGQASFEACLQQIKGFGENPGRPVEDTYIQAGNLNVNGDRISGDVVRFQGDNLPSLIKTKGVKPEKLDLSTDSGLGHHAAFLYDQSIHVLAYQFARNAVPLGLFNRYIAVACENPGFGFLPVISVSDLKQLNKITPKTLLIKVADPDALDAVEDDQRKLRASLRNLRSLADGMYIKVQIGLANNKGQLDKAKVGNLVTWLLEQRGIRKGKVGAVQVSGKDFQEGDVDLDFIRSQLWESKTLPLKEAGQDENYKVRATYLGECMDKHYSTLKKFKPKD
jgi:hypothetical protein